MDISKKALDRIVKRNPYIKIVQEDLKTIQHDHFNHTFDLVISCYCLHHIVNIDDFINASRFVGKCVKPDGFLILMDPILTMPFSRFDVIDFSSYEGNGIARHLYLIDDILSKDGLRRQTIQPAVSFLLNGTIQSYNWFIYSITNTIWKIFCIFYKSDHFVSLLSKLLTNIDHFLKQYELAFSSSVCIYKKSSHDLL